MATKATTHIMGIMIDLEHEAINMNVGATAEVLKMAIKAITESAREGCNRGGMVGENGKPILTFIMEEAPAEAMEQAAAAVGFSEEAVESLLRNPNGVHKGTMRRPHPALRSIKGGRGLDTLDDDPKVVN